MPNERDEKIGIFLSYARADEPKAAKIRERLQRKAPDIQIKQDRLFLEGGVGWWNQITAAGCLRLSRQRSAGFRTSVRKNAPLDAAARSPRLLTRR
jgi:hypothetical protein